MIKKTSVEIVDIDKCLDAFEGSRFKLILGAAKRGREIANKRIFEERNNIRLQYPNKPLVTALVEIAEGKVDAKELYKAK